jgi:putative salt-induced outer membrane protein
MALFLAPLLLANAEPAPVPADPPASTEQWDSIPDDIQTMLLAAMKAGNETEVTTLVKFAKNAAPHSAKAIQAEVDGWHKARADAALAKIHDASPFDLWKGKVALGGYVSTGNTHDIGFNGTVDLSRETIQWRHTIHLQVDYLKSAGVVTREHYLATYEPNYKISDRTYAYGDLEYESDHYLGYNDRYSASVGGGYSAIKTPRMTLNLELGPAYRDTEYADHSLQSSVAARGSVDFGWKLTPAISVTQQTSAFWQHYDSTVTSTSALNAKLIGPLAAQFSYNVQYESMPPVGSTNMDTTSRASLVYAF